MHESNTCKVATPAEREWDGTDVREAAVATSFSLLEPFVAVLPDTFFTVRTGRFADNLLKIRLQKKGNFYKYWMILNLNDYTSAKS